VKTAVLRCCGEDIIGIVELAVGLRDRMVGLLGRDSLGGGKAMYLSPCNCIHTFFMRFNLDLIFLDRSQRVVRIVREIRPNRIASGGAGAHSVIEMESGWFLTEKVRVGEQVELIDASTGERQA
jgi:uncharacterized membrane protein (UPF0127 family)